MLRKYAIASLMTFAVASTASANVLVNSGFESGDLTGWTVAGNAPLGFGVGTAGKILPSGYYGTSKIVVGSGNYAFWIMSRNLLGEFIDLSQTVDLSGGTYNIGFTYGSNQGPFGNATSIFLDGKQIASGSGNIINGLQTETAQQLISAGTHTFTFHLAGSGTVALPLSADNFYVSNINGDAVVPEPGSIALLGLGLLGMGAMLRKGRR